MDTEQSGRTSETLTVRLEDAATRSVWTSMLGLLSSQTQMWHFVGMVDGHVAYRSPTFAAPYSWGRLPLGRTPSPQEQWAPGMQQALEELRAEIRRDGWIGSGHGEHPWEDVYRRPAVTSP